MEATERCRWFALCDRPATGTTFHPILGDVPTCERCDAFATLDNPDQESDAHDQ